jgi:hypothetical protein
MHVLSFLDVPRPTSIAGHAAPEGETSSQISVSSSGFEEKRELRLQLPVIYAGIALTRCTENDDRADETAPTASASPYDRRSGWRPSI